MNKYNNYIEAEISWLKKIPIHWTAFRFIDNVNLRHGFQFRDYDFTDLGLKVIKISQLSPDGYLDLSDCSFISLDRLSSFRSILIKEGDILMALTGGTIGKIIRVGEVNEPLLQNYRVGNFFPKPTQLNKIFTYYLLASQITEEQINYLLNRNGQPNIGKESFKNMFFPQPPMEEQTAIAEYLDNKTRAIDKKVGLLEKKKGYYQELRKTLINETVTKGLDATVKLKASGVDWIGEIPEHWEVIRIKDYTYIKARIGWQGLRSDEFESTGDYYCVTGTDFQNGQIDWSNCYYVKRERFEQDKKIIIREGDLLITKDGSIGKIAIVQSLPKPATLNSGVFVTRPKIGKYLNRYMYWLLNSNVFLDFIDLNKNGTTILHLYQNVFENFFYCLPPIKEQIEIANYLLEKTSKIDQIITNIQTQIDTLKELRKTLINDVVTGKIKVIQD